MSCEILGWTLCITKLHELRTWTDLCNPFPVHASVCRHAENKDACSMQGKVSRLVFQFLCVHVSARDSEKRAWAVWPHAAHIMWHHVSNVIYSTGEQLYYLESGRENVNYSSYFLLTDSCDQWCIQLVHMRDKVNDVQQKTQREVLLRTNHF